jgi:hypothetical protein
MKNLNQEIKFENFNEFLLADEEMINVRGGDGDRGDNKGTVIPPVVDPEL